MVNLEMCTYCEFGANEKFASYGNACVIACTFPSFNEDRLKLRCNVSQDFRRFDGTIITEALVPCATEGVNMQDSVDLQSYGNAIPDDSVWACLNWNWRL